MHVTDWRLLPSNVMPAADVLTKFHRKGIWILQAVKKLLFVNTAEGYLLIRISALLKQNNIKNKLYTKAGILPAFFIIDEIVIE